MAIETSRDRSNGDSLKSVCGCDEANRLRAELAIVTAQREKLRADMRRLKARAPVITDDPYFYEVANAIDLELGWRTEEDEEGGRYADRIKEVAAELRTLRAERDYLLDFADPKDVRAMRRELAHEDEGANQRRDEGSAG